MPLSRFQPEHYAALLQQKQQYLQTLLTPFWQGEIDVFASATEGFRMRAEFRFWQDDDDAYYVMFPQGQPENPVRIDDFPFAHARIRELMPKLRQAVLNNPLLKQKLFQVEFLCGLSGDSLITLIYHKPLDEQWQQAAEQLQQQLNSHIIGRSRRQKIVLGQDYINETLQVNSKPWHYRQVEGSFTQPNAGINQQMLAWAQRMAGEQSNTDFLELYCGNGNFTLPLAGQFRQVLATEISKSSVHSAQYNLADNRIDNTRIIRMSSEEFTEALNGEREFRRLLQQGIDLSNYDFSTVLVDPPRAGLDNGTLALIARFDRILYISCNPHTLADNLQQLQNTHDIKAAALFDQFPYTDHIETGLLLQQKTETKW